MNGRIDLNLSSLKRGVGGGGGGGGIINVIKECTRNLKQIVFLLGSAFNLFFF